jgi:hypothetical protein
MRTFVRTFIRSLVRPLVGTSKLVIPITAAVVASAVVLVGLLPSAYADQAAQTKAERAKIVARAALDRAIALGSDSIVPKQVLAGAEVGDLHLIHDAATLEVIYGVVTVRRQDGGVVGLIGMDPNLERVQWYRFNYQYAAFPVVSAEEARAKARARARALGEEEPLGEPMLVRGCDKHFYWRFESPTGTACFVDIDRPEAQAVSTSEASARGVTVPAEDVGETRREMLERQRSRWPAERLLDDLGTGAGSDGGPDAGLETGLGATRGTRPEAYNIPGIPYHYQITDYNCGPASLEMTMDYCGEEVLQASIADVANTIEGVGTYGDDLLRSAHFSGMSVAVQDPLLVGYAERKLGYSGEEYPWGLSPLAERYEDLKTLTAAGYPVLILTWYDTGHGSGHFRVVKGYDDNLGVFVVHDPWYYGFSGPDLLVDQTVLVENLWGYSWWWGMLSMPWVLRPAVATSVDQGDTLEVNLRVHYPGPYPFNGAYQCSSCQATITLSAGLALAGGSPTVSLANLQSGDSATVTWNVVAVGPTGEWGMSFRAQGTVSGSSGAYPSYTDSIGGRSYETVSVTSGLLADWSAEERLTDEEGSSQTAWPGSRAMVMEDDGTVHLVWADTRDGNSEIYYRARSGGVWGAESRLTSDSAFSDGPCITCGPDGRLHVAWVDTRDGNKEIYYKYCDDLTGWSADERVSTYSEDDHNPSIAADTGGVYLAWQRRVTGGGLHYYYVVFSRRTAGTWSSPTDVDASPERDSYRPSLAAGVDGRLHLVYERQSANSPNEMERIVYRYWNGSAWSARTGLSTDLSYSRGPVIAAAGDGTLHVVWQDGENVGGDIFYAMHNGTSWQTVEEIVTGGSDAAEPSVAAAADGSVYVAWADYRHGEPEIYFMSKDGSGWSQQARLSRAAGASILPAVATSTYGDPCIAWTDLRHENAEVYFRASSLVAGVPAGGGEPASAARVSLARPYPVPSRGAVRVGFTVREASTVALEVFDVGGRCVATLAHGTYDPGTYDLSWNGRNDRGEAAGAGIYFIRCYARDRDSRDADQGQVAAVVLIR